MKYFLFGLLILSLQVNGQSDFVWSHGGIIRGDTLQKKIALISSADIDGDGVPFMDSVLHSMNLKGSFFFTGNYFSNPANRRIVLNLLKHGSYVGSHSFGHLLYCDWVKRDSLLVSHREFKKDMEKSFGALKKFGIGKPDAHFFMPPYEWYNDSIALWATEFGLQVINFSPGTYSNADYTTPDMGSRYLSSDTIYNRILRYEEEHKNGLNGFLLLVHGGSSAKRTDKFYRKLPQLIRDLQKRGYQFVRVDELLK